MHEPQDTDAVPSLLRDKVPALCQPVNSLTGGFPPSVQSFARYFYQTVGLLVVVLSALTYSGTCYSLKGMCLCY